MSSLIPAARASLVPIYQGVAVLAMVGVAAALINLYADVQVIKSRLGRMELILNQIAQVR